MNTRNATFSFFFFFFFFFFLRNLKNIYILVTLRKQAYSNILKILPPKWKFSDKNSDIFYISAQNIDCGYSLEPPQRGGSNEYPQSMFLSRDKQIMYTPVNPILLYKSEV